MVYCNCVALGCLVGWLILDYRQSKKEEDISDQYCSMYYRSINKCSSYRFFC